MLAGIDAIGGFVTGGGAAGSFAATVDQPTISKTLSTRGASKLVQTSTVTVIPSGGIPGYSYAWTDLSGSGILANSPSSATTAFHETLSPDQSVEGTMRCTVTDNVGSHVTVDVDVTLTLVDVS